MFGRKRKVDKAVARALAPVEAEDDVADHAPLEALPEELRAEAYLRVATALHRDERYAAARRSLAPLLERVPDSPQVQRLAAAIASELGDHGAVIAAQRRVVELAPTELAPLLALTASLIDTEQLDEAIRLLRPRQGEGDPELATRLAEALFAHGESAEALEILDEVCAGYRAQMKRHMVGDWEGLKARAEEASRLRDDVYAELHGREATIELAAAAGNLDAHAGVNYRLLGARLAATGTRVADVLELDAPDACERRGQARLQRAPGDAGGLVLVGIAQLRRGDVAAARRTFERASEADGRCFAAFFGLGAALDHEQYQLHRRAARLAVPPPWPAALEAVVPDHAALTEAERRVVWASARPLASLLPALAERGVAMRILPIDVRATDVELFEDIAGERADDQRSYDAISGVATHGGAIAKIEELLDIVSDSGWTFAHELAHLAFFHMPEAQQAPLLALYARAVEVGYANIDYALSNPDEFFAVSYAEYLRERHELPGVPPDDDAGLRRALVSYFARLEARAT